MTRIETNDEMKPTTDTAPNEAKFKKRRQRPNETTNYSNETVFQNKLHSLECSKHLNEASIHTNKQTIIKMRPTSDRNQNDHK